MSRSALLALPAKIRSEIYRLAFGPQLRIEMLADNRFLAPRCPLLQVNHAFQQDVLNAFATETMTTVWVFRNPAALANTSPELHRLDSPSSQPRITTIQLELLSPLGDGSQLTHDERGGSSSGPNIAPLYKAWRDTIAGLPVDMSVRVVRFDLSHSWTWQSLSIARLVHNLSVVFHRRTRGAVRFEIVGCKTEEGRRFIEKSTFGLAEPSSTMRQRGFRAGAE